MNEHQMVTFFNLGRTSIHFPVLFVCCIKWQIQYYDWSDSLSIKLSVNGQLFTFSTSYRINVNYLDNLDKFDEKYFNSH